jgi:hypothetical protein
MGASMVCPRAQDCAISAMVNWRASYIRWALSISLGVIFGLRPPVRPRTRAAASPAWAGVTPMTIYRNITTVQTTANWGRT